MKFLEIKPTGFSKRGVHRVGSALRDGEPYDEEVFNRFIDHQAGICEAVWGVVADEMSCLIAPFQQASVESVKPSSGAYTLSARVKTKTTLVEKLQRMEKYPLENIQDVAGVRIDCDLTLDEQTELAEIFRRGLLTAGASRVDTRDLRTEPHSGYRAIHLHIHSPAGRAELQLRTALQAQWANLYEVAADIYGRSIRYLEEGEEVDPKIASEVKVLHEAADFVYMTEKLNNRVTRPFAGGMPEDTAVAEIRQVRKNAYDILDKAMKDLRKVRTTMEAEELTEK